MTPTRDTADIVPLDGNAVAGMLGELFAFDITAARLACAGCGTEAEMGAIRVYGGTMGAIFRCFHCDTAMFRVAKTPRGFTIDFRGARRFTAQPLA